MARISTHVLDTARGRPASGVVIDLYFGGELVRSATTNGDGRTDQPLLNEDRIAPGQYELIFHTGDYLRYHGHPDPLFFDDITLRFAVSEETGNYHVPLLLAPYGYTTYRGS